MDEGVQIPGLAGSAQRPFERQDWRDKRRLLNFVLSNCVWEDGGVRATFRQPFDLWAKTAAIGVRYTAGTMAGLVKGEIWLPFLDTYRTMCVAPAGDFRRLLQQVSALQHVAGMRELIDIGINKPVRQP